MKTTALTSDFLESTESREPPARFALGNSTSLATRALEPFLKWPGGKRWFVAGHRALLPKRLRGRYIEPFLGGGSVFFALAPARALLGDKNRDLVDAYLGVRDKPEDLFFHLKTHHFEHCNDWYYAIRDSRPLSLEGRAARFIYLNRTGFNGIYRVNQAGVFNVPVGSKTAVLYEHDDFHLWSEVLRNAAIECSDFEALIDEAAKGDFVFADPPYTVHHNRNGFNKYNEVLFSWADQERLARALDRARRRGARILMTNAAHSSVERLFGRGFETRRVLRFSHISASTKGRAPFEELVVLA